MIEELRITSLGVIEESVLELDHGLSVITGETGAGKTMLVTALGLLLGSRADSGAVRTGAGRARVEGRFTAGPEVRAALEELGGDADEDGSVLLARQVSAEGRSRAFAGGASVPVGTLAELTAPLVAVHGQSDQHRLLRPETQRECLDRFAGAPVEEPLARYGEDYRRLREVERELDEVLRSTRERAQEADLLRHGLEEVERTAPQPGEDVALLAEEQRLGNADTLRVAAEQAREVLSSEDGAPDALGAVAAARRLLEDVRADDPEAAALADRLAEASYLLGDVAADVASYSTGLDSDPARLAEVSERRAALSALTRKYGDTVDEVLAWSERSARRLLDLDDTDEVLGRLRAERETLRTTLGELAAEISRARAEAAVRLGEQVTAELTELAMPHARIEVTLTRAEAEESDGLPVEGRHLRFGRDGVDEVAMLLAANTGAEPRPLGKGASGGELSRVMLAVEVVLSDVVAAPTFVFDEVDAGVGGKAAVEIGRRLAALARHAQVVVVTHLPQVAAFADRHVVVRKSSDGLVTTSGLLALDDADRVRELSRMLAGLEESETAIAHAEELLATAREVRGAG
ncbi:DNA repair protein RecN [Marmoricola endophyticus]|uniref:DNA repair protein RecN n=1 Tax=Marmoricola endophyticus TaxID=2040280 RepID=A0A917BCD3_9ACTN|nr:DNA repair protein RecN [Marmoricola endophyticus]GGF35343.1 DNA repair protein RecN [Marmoricola endophyticus]